MKEGAGLTPRQQYLVELSALPSSFPTYVGQTVLREIPATVEAQNKFIAGFQAFMHGNTAEDVATKESHYTEALQSFQDAIKEANAGFTNPGSASETNTYQWIGNCYIELYKLTKDKDKQLEYLKAAEENYSYNIRPFMDDVMLYNAEVNLKNVAFSHMGNGTIEAYKAEQQHLLNEAISFNDQYGQLQARLALGGIARVQGNHLEAIEHYAKSWEFTQGQVDYEAHRVEQREVGFSSSEKIGTENIQQCVVLIIWDPTTKRTALAHVDIYTDPKSIQTAVLEQFKAKGEGEKPYEVTIVGGRDRLSRQPNGELTSDVNINKVLGELESWGVKHTIKAADIGDKGAPSGIVFDPVTGVLEHAVPGIHDKTTPERIARMLNIDTTALHSLNFAFDFSQNRVPEATLTEEVYKTQIRNAIGFTQSVQFKESFHAGVIGQSSVAIAKDKPNIMAKILIEDVIKDIAKSVNKTVSCLPEELSALEAHITKEVSKLNVQGKSPADIYNGLKPEVQKAFQVKTFGEKLKPKNWFGSIKEELLGSVKVSITVPKDITDEAIKTSAAKKSEVVSKKKMPALFWTKKVESERGTKTLKQPPSIEK